MFVFQTISLVQFVRSLLASKTLKMPTPISSPISSPVKKQKSSEVLQVAKLSEHATLPTKVLT